MVTLPVDLMQSASLACVLAGVSALVIEARDLLRRGLPLAMDFWLAAGLLRLSESVAWSSILIAATVVLLRKLLSFSIHLSRRES